MNTETKTHYQEGSALPVGMILLVVLTLLGVAGMNASRMELAMAGNLQNYEYVHQAAEAGLQLAMAANPPSITLNTGPKEFELPANANDSASGTYSVQWIMQSPVPSGGSSISGDFTAQHFIATSTAALEHGNQTATHVQGYFVIAPGG